MRFKITCPVCDCDELEWDAKEQQFNCQGCMSGFTCESISFDEINE